jgi:hypothetical protein
MRKAITGCLLLLGTLSVVQAQPLFQESFDTSAVLPAGWEVWNRAPFPIYPQANWTVRDSNIVPPGTAGLYKTKSHSGLHAVGVSWWASMDTTAGTATIADAWLITPPIAGIRSGDGVRFWATGGTPNFSDTLQVLVGVDSIPSNALDTIAWAAPSVFGLFAEYVLPFPPELTGMQARVGFRYNMNCTTSGFYVHVDDVSIDQVTSVAEHGRVVPASFGLDPNYPNPFNGVTRIGFRVPAGAGGEGVRLAVYDLLGREVAVLVDAPLAPGSYAMPFDAAGLASGIYLARLQAGGHVETRRMILMK